MTRLEKLLKIREAYEVLIPCVKNNVVQDYGLVLAVAPALLTELINEEKQAAEAPAIQMTEVKPSFEWNLDLVKKVNNLDIDESLRLGDGRRICCREDQTANDVSQCAHCAIPKLGAGSFCNLFYCTPRVRYDGKYVHFELTGELDVDNSTQPNKEEDHA